MSTYPLIIQPREIKGRADEEYIYSTLVQSVCNQYPWRIKNIVEADSLVSLKHDREKIYIRPDKIRNGIDKNTASALWHAQARNMIRGAKCLIACDPKYEDQIFGYILYDIMPRVLYFCYTKYDFRRVGVATRLYEQAFGSFEIPTDYAILTTGAKSLERRWNMSYNSRHLIRLEMRNGEK